MSIFDFLFPEQSAAMQLRRIVDQKEQDRRIAEVHRRNQERRRKREFAAEKAMPSQAAIVSTSAPTSSSPLWLPPWKPKAP